MSQQVYNQQSSDDVEIREDVWDNDGEHTITPQEITAIKDD